MKCSKCGNEFEGNFCPQCGASAVNETGAYYSQPATPPPNVQQPVYQQPPQGKPKKKKPFFLRWWFILLCIIVALIVAVSVNSKGEKIVWSDMVMGEMLPEPPANRGDIYSNNIETLSVDINDVSEKEYAEYVEDCKEEGFDIDLTSDGSSYEAYNKDGYRLSLNHYTDSLDILLESPDAISEDESDDFEDTTEDTTEEAPETTEKTTESQEVNNGEIRPEFKKSMDEYEKFFDEYVDFMKAYQENPSAAGMMSKYADMMKQYAKTMEEIDNLGQSEMNDKEALYYAEVSARISSKLLEVAE